MAKAKDTTHSGIPTPMFANDVLGDCVIAGRAHQALRFRAEVEFLNSEQVRQAIHDDVGVGLGLQTNDPPSELGSWDGDYIYVPGYTAQGPVCVTWGPKQQMTWAWLGKYCGEVHGSRPEPELAFTWS
jgi:hypothetical protein